MLKNYIKMAFRILVRHKVFSLINILGLALGMTCSILILLWVQDELSYDRFHKNIDQLYRVVENQYYPGADNLATVVTPGILADAMKEELPEVDDAVRMTTGWQELFSNGDKALKVEGRYADASFFQMFSFPLLQGNAEQVLQQPKSVVISDSIAIKFFGTTQAVGRILRRDNSESYKVTGVMQSVPKNSSMQFDVVMPYNDYGSRPGAAWLKGWGNTGVFTYLLLKPGTDILAFNQKIKPFIKQKEAESNAELFVQSVKDIHLYSDFRQGKSDTGKIVYVRLFSVVGIFVLLIACINFMNLATARSAKRAKEVGVRKTIGASKSALVIQFMIESLLITFVALFVSLNLIGLLLPRFNELVGKTVALDLTDHRLIIMVLGVAVITGFLSGSYPAFFLSSFKPVVVLKGSVSINSSAVAFRKGLVVFQFVLSTLLIVSTLVVYLQMHYIRSKNLGLNRENVVYLPFEGEVENKYRLVKQELQQVPSILSVSAVSQNPLQISMNTGDVSWDGKEPGANVLIDLALADYDFLETMGIELKVGRDFSKAFKTDTAAYILNEEAVRLMQMKEPVGQRLHVWDDGHIIGVVKNFHSRSMHTPVQPLIIQLDQYNASSVYIRIAPGKTTEALAAIEKVVHKYNSSYPFEYTFLDESFERMYKSESIIGQLTNYFAGVAIFISCLGLFGLALFTAEQRKKEIGVRKVLGASTSGIVFMLSKDFLKLVLVANLIALPLSWYLMSGWLDGYAYRTDLSWWIFAAAFLATIIIAMLTLSFHAIKTAVANPVTSLRTE